MTQVNKICTDNCTLFTGDAIDAMSELADCSVQMICTSPPYYGLRDYGNEKQIGLEHSPHEYIDRLVCVFRECKRIMREDGILYVNIGDCYANNKNTRYKNKDLIGIPWMLAFSLRDDGWYLRMDNIWAKTNCMPESVKDRTTRSHEYVFMFSKSNRYFYDAEAIKEPAIYPNDDRGGRTDNRRGTKMNSVSGSTGTTRNKRSVWTIPTSPYRKAHFATFPPALAEIMIRSGSSEYGSCSICAAPYKRITSREKSPKSPYSDVRHTTQGTHRKLGSQYQIWLDAHPITTTGWQQSCSCHNANPVPCTILDPFNGAGTSGLVALRESRKYIGIDLNQEYIDLTVERLGLKVV